MRFTIRTITLVVTFLAATQVTTTAAVVHNSANGNYYEALSVVNTWTVAHDLAASSLYLGIQGHLATITSQEENDFILEMVLPIAYNGYWIGGMQIGGPEPLAGWRWITDEPWDFSNWDTNEPNDARGSENFLQIYSKWEGPPVPSRRLPGTWNDVRDQDSFDSSGYVIEYSIPEPGYFGLGFIGVTMLAFYRRRYPPHPTQPIGAQQRG